MNIVGHSAPEEVMAFLDGELAGAEARLMTDHLEHCAECAALADQFRSTSQMLSRWDVEAVPVVVEDSVRALVTESGGRSKIWSSKSSRFVNGKLLFTGAGAMAVAALLMLAVLLPLSNRRNLGSAALNERARGYIAPELADKAKSQQFDRLDRFARLPESMGAASQDEVVGRAVGGIAGMGSPVGNADQLKVSSMPAPMIAREEWLVIRVKDVETSRSFIDSILARHHGYPAQINVTSPEIGPRGLQASLRIPTAELLSAVGEIKGLGRVENESQSGEEVSQQHIDLVARLKTARETEERFQAILQQRTGKISDVLEVEQNIARVRGEIESMEAEQKALEHRVDFASVEVQLTEEYKAQIGLPADSVSTRMHNAFVAGYHHAAESVVGLALFVEEYGPSLVLWLVILGLPIIVVWRRYKRVRATL